MTSDRILKTEKFLKNSFQKNPHFSFDNWKVMYNHSQKVKKIALKISKNFKCDEELLAIGALLHDIGKTHKGPQEDLHYNHEKYNLKQSKKILKNLHLTKYRLRKLQKILSFKSRSVEQKILKDADALALFADKQLYTLYINWAIKEKLYSSILRKVDKFNKLNYKKSKKIGTIWFNNMKRDWLKSLLKSNVNLTI